MNKSIYKKFDYSGFRMLSGFVLAILLFCSTTGSGVLLASHVDIVTVDGPITPVTAKYIGDAVRKAERNGAECLIIQMDTPGGLMQSTWTIDKDLLSDRVPVIVYVSPSGGRAASAGVYISYAAHFVAMAPSTNIGSAHPVTMMGKDTSKVMLEKVTNDAVAHIKGLASKRGRNAEWAEDAVRKSVNITEKEAIEKGVIDFIARDLYHLLSQLDGKDVRLGEREVVLHTANAETRRSPMSWRYKILDKISDPNIAYLLMLAGIMGIFFELQNPGAIFPGVIGAISLILAFFALQVLPINAAGVLLILLAIVFFILEINIPSFGLLTMGGVASMILGSLMLFRSPELKVSLSIIIPAVLFTAAFFVFAVGLGLRAQMKKASTGQKGIVGEKGVALGTLHPEGQVSVHGEVWKAVSSEKIKKGEKIEVIDVEGLVLKVRRISH
jgi:membrane-bound serine protease (ClpP class)